MISYVALHDRCPACGCSLTEHHGIDLTPVRGPWTYVLCMQCERGCIYRTRKGYDVRPRPSPPFTRVERTDPIPETYRVRAYWREFLRAHGIEEARHAQ